MTTTDTLAERIGRILNEEGWTFEGVHEPGEYDECEDCRRAVDPIAARIATVAHAHLAAQEPTDAEVGALIDSLAEQAGVSIMPLIASRALRDARLATRRYKKKRAACGCDLTGLVPPAVHIVDRHETGDQT